MSEATDAAKVSSELKIDRKNMSPLYLHAAKTSERAQRNFFLLLGIELVMLPLAVLIGSFNGIVTEIGPVSLVTPPFPLGPFHIPALSYFQITEAVLLVFALVARMIRFIARPEILWYEARAVAESVKSLAWRYMVGGEPFQEALSDDALNAVVTDRFQHIRTDLSRYKAPDEVAERHWITPEMRAIRKESLAARKRLYREQRVQNQLDWYTRNAQSNRVRWFNMHSGIIAVEALASVAALLPLGLAAIHLFPLNLQSVATNVAGSGAAWMQAKRYEDLNASYRVTAKELKKVDATIARQENETDEAAWGRLVENVEGSMSREHQLWRATRIDTDE